MPVLLEKQVNFLLVDGSSCGFDSNLKLMPFDIIDNASCNSEDDANDGENSGLLENTNHCQDKANEADDSTHNSNQRNQSQ